VERGFGWQLFRHLAILPAQVDAGQAGLTTGKTRRPCSPALGNDSDRGRREQSDVSLETISTGMRSSSSGCSPNAIAFDPEGVSSFQSFYGGVHGVGHVGMNS
jgi:hypothetical protein